MRRARTVRARDARVTRAGPARDALDVNGVCAGHAQYVRGTRAGRAREESRSCEGRAGIECTGRVQRVFLRGACAGRVHRIQCV